MKRLSRAGDTKGAADSVVLTSSLIESTLDLLLLWCALVSFLKVGYVLYFFSTYIMYFLLQDIECEYI